MKLVLFIIFALGLAAERKTYALIEATDPALGMESGAIKDSWLSASQSWDNAHAPRCGRLNVVNYAGCYSNSWSARALNDWVMVDLQKKYAITAIALQGRAGWSPCQRTTKFAIDWSINGLDWVSYRGGELVGNADCESVVTNVLTYPFTARFVKLIVTGFDNHPSLRFEVYGHEVSTTGPINEFGELVDHLGFRIEQEESASQKAYDADMTDINNRIGEYVARIELLKTKLIPDAQKLSDEQEADIEAHKLHIAQTQKTIDELNIRVSKKQSEIAALKAKRDAEHQEYMTKIGDVDEVVDALKTIGQTSLQTTTKLSLLQLPATLQDKVNALVTSKWDPTDQESFERLKQLLAMLLDELFGYRTNLDKAEAMARTSFLSTLASLNKDLHDLITELLNNKEAKAKEEAELASDEVEHAKTEMELEALEEELDLKTDALADLRKEKADKEVAFQAEKARRQKERETLDHLRGVMASVKIEPHVAEAIKHITVGGAAQIVCAESMRNDAATITCPWAGWKIYRIQFASFGRPEGNCPNYKINPVCHAVDMTILNACIGKESCEVPPVPVTCNGDGHIGWKIQAICQGQAVEEAPVPKVDCAVGMNSQGGVVTGCKQTQDVYVITTSATFKPSIDVDPCKVVSQDLSLVSIHSAVANKRVQDAINAAGYTRTHECWTGMIYRSPRGWYWRDNSAFNYVNWNTNEPNGNANEPNSAMYPPSGLWNDEGWSAHACFACSYHPLN
jgi:Skp family chaperone for outer membrane proteins